MAAIRTNAVNAWESTLSSALASGATTVNVVDTTGSPAVPFYPTVDPGNDTKREVVRVTAKTATSFTVVRGEDGTSDVNHDPDAVIALVPVAAMWNDLHDRVDVQVAEADHTKAAHDALGLAHGSLAGLVNDDHTQYLNTARHDAHDHTTALGTASITDLADVDTTGAATDNLLKFNGTNWVPGSGGSGGTTSSARVDTAETTTSTAYTDLATVGPQVTVDVGSSGQLEVLWIAQISNNTAGSGGQVSFALSGANTLAAAETRNIVAISAGANQGYRFAGVEHLTGLAAGSTTVTLKYQVATGGTAQFLRRLLIVRVI